MDLNNFNNIYFLLIYIIMVNIVKQMKKIDKNIIIKIFYMLCMFNFIFNKKINCFIISIATTLILYFIVKKNIDISMLISLMLSIFVFNCNKILELNDGETKDTTIETTTDAVDIDETDPTSDTSTDDPIVDETATAIATAAAAGVTDGSVDASKLANAIAKAQAAGVIAPPKGNVEEQRKKALKSMNDRLLRCQTGTLKPYDKCIEERNARMMGDEVATDTTAPAITETTT